MKLDVNEDFSDVSIDGDSFYLNIGDWVRRFNGSRTRVHGALAQTKRSIHSLVAPTSYYEGRIKEVDFRIAAIALEITLLPSSDAFQQICRSYSFIFDRPGPLYGTYRAELNEQGKKKVLEVETQKLCDEREKLLKEQQLNKEALDRLRKKAGRTSPYR